MIYGAPSQCMSASPLFFPRVQAFSHLALASACPIENTQIKRAFGANFWTVLETV
jgi:hypothetical protein